MLFTNTYSGLITKGLGMPACCALLTANFGLICGCSIAIIEPPPGGGGGGGSYAVEPGIYVPWPKKITPKSKMVLVTVKFSPEKTWRRSYVLPNTQANILVKAFNVVNSATAKMTVGVNQLKLATKRVTALFKRDDK